MLNEERKVLAQFSQYANVVEPWALYDSIIICSDFYGNESSVPGWFTTYAAFSQQETHSFFKSRTEGTAGLQYTNMQSSDSMDFAFVAHSIGIGVLSPAPNIEGELGGADGIAGEIENSDSLIGHFLAADLPRHMGIQLKIQQDIRAECAALHAPPGYGVVGSGVAYDFPNAVAPLHGDVPYMNFAVSQGVPALDNRYPFPEPIGIPRTATIEAVLHLSEYARWVLADVYGPRGFMFNSSDGAPPYTVFPRRYVIQVSLFGERLVQQRGQYHR
jgi:hypothetical protein